MFEAKGDEKMIDKKFVDFGKLEDCIRESEKLFVSFGLCSFEVDIVLRQLMMRQEQKDKNRQAQDMIGNLSLGGIVKNVFKSVKKQQDEKGDEES
jgi:hypothetical protein